MDLGAFLTARKPRWERLARLLDRAEVEGIDHLQLEEVKELGRLYRAASSDLLMARGRAASAELVTFLNDLVARGHAQTHLAPSPRLLEGARFLAFGFPALVRAEKRLVLLSYALMALGIGTGMVAAAVDPEAVAVMIPDQHRRLDPTERVNREAERPGSTNGDEQAVFATYLFTHNIQVAFFCFALGITFGVGTLALLWWNGVTLGALAHVYAAQGHALWFWAWILPHGVPELSAICLAGASGLAIGRGLLFPGRRTTGAALRSEAKVAVQLVLGTIPLFIVAGLIEGSISQIHQPTLPSELKLTFAAAVAALLGWWLITVGRPAR